MITIREATIADAPKMLELINQYAQEGLMLPKTPYKVYTTIQNFFVAEADGKVVGCCALNVLWNDLCEVCSLAVDNSYKGQGIGKQLVLQCVEKAKALMISQVFTLTYQDRFFEKLNFLPVSKDAFPRKLWRECLECPKLEQCDEKAYILRLF